MVAILKRITSCLIVVCLTIAILAGLTDIVEYKASEEKYAQFFQQEADFDVLFVGSSKILNGVLPMELWNDYGIVSYNLGGHANTIPTSYWVLRNALEYTTPKCVVFDCMGSQSNERVTRHFDYSHLSFDAFPLSQTKIQAVCDLVSPDDWEDYTAKRLELLWNFSIYHNSWSGLQKGAYVPDLSYQKGAEPRVNVSIPVEMATVSPECRNTWDTLGMEYLIKMVELCKEKNIDVLLIHLPYPASEDTLIGANTVADVAKAQGVEYLNFFNMDVVDYQTDMYDPDSHLNPSGALKITDYLGQILTERYNIPDQRNHPDYQSWHNDAKMYHQEKIDLFAEVSSAWNYWMLLSDDDFSFVAEISEQDIRQDDVLAALLHNAGIQPEKVQERCIIVSDRSSGSVAYLAYETLHQGAVETPLGTLSINETSVKLDGQECWQVHPSTATPAAIHFALFDSEKRLVESTSFSAAEIYSKEAD